MERLGRDIVTSHNSKEGSDWLKCSKQQIILNQKQLQRLSAYLQMFFIYKESHMSSNNPSTHLEMSWFLAAVMQKFTLWRQQHREEHACHVSGGRSAGWFSFTVFQLQQLFHGFLWWFLDRIFCHLLFFHYCWIYQISEFTLTPGERRNLPNSSCSSFTLSQYFSIVSQHVNPYYKVLE